MLGVPRPKRVALFPGPLLKPTLLTAVARPARNLGRFRLTKRMLARQAPDRCHPGVVSRPRGGEHFSRLQRARLPGIGPRSDGDRIMRFEHRDA